MQENPSSNVDNLDGDFAPDERLFHYTSSQGLYGILDSGCLWATHFKFLNDSNEFFSAKKSLTEFVQGEVADKMAKDVAAGKRTLIEDSTVEDFSKDAASLIVGSMYGSILKLADPFIFSSFITKTNHPRYRSGELLHWATYGRDGGYALEINPHKLTTLLPNVSLVLRPAVYVDDVVPPELADQYKLISSVGLEMVDGILDETLDSVDIGRSAEPFSTVASVIKDGYFRSECEARLVLMRFKSGNSDRPQPSVFMRQKQGHSIPYIKLFEQSLLGTSCPIESIVIGPHPDRSRREDALAIFLEANNLGHIQIVHSDVPYLGG